MGFQIFRIVRNDVGFRTQNVIQLAEWIGRGVGDSNLGVTFNGRLFGESQILALARAYQEATGFHRRHPEGFAG